MERSGGMSSGTIPGLLDARCAVSPEKPAFFTLDSQKRWEPVSWMQFSAKVRRISATLINAGLKKGDRVAILAPTSLNWEYAQIGSLAASALVAGIDPGYPPDQLDEVIKFLGPSVLFVHNRTTLEKISKGVRDRIGLIVFFDGVPRDVAECSIHNMLATDVETEFERTCAGPSPGDAAMMIFSSGTTGSPKAIVYSHEQALAAIDAILAAFDDINDATVLLCWLPLANLFQRLINFCAISRGAMSYILENPRELMHYIGSVEPHVLIGVPRVFERMQRGIVEQIEKLSPPIRFLTRWALHTGQKHALSKLARAPGKTGISGYFVADKLILKRLRAIFGRRLRYFVSGSAPMPLWLLDWFDALGLPVIEGYGVSENLIPIATNRPSLRKRGTVGQVLAPNHIRFTSDGEILVRGPCVFKRYWNTKDSSGRFTADGYLRTGDLGRSDEEGFISLLGRTSEVFKTPEGKWISPARIEEQLRHAAYIEHAVVLQLGPDTIASILSIDKEKLLDQAGIQFKREMPLNEECFQREFIKENLTELLKELPAYQRIAGALVTFQEFSIAGGELTPNLKLRRKPIIARYASDLKVLETTIDEARIGRSGGRPTTLSILLTS
jgi:long-chain acyl-CoA synthetase